MFVTPPLTTSTAYCARDGAYAIRKANLRGEADTGLSALEQPLSGHWLFRDLTHGYGAPPEYGKDLFHFAGRFGNDLARLAALKLRL
jgi:hypothetical protein